MKCKLKKRKLKGLNWTKKTVRFGTFFLFYKLELLMPEKQKMWKCAKSWENMLKVDKVWECVKSW